jgi:hypothetical protein
MLVYWTSWICMYLTLFRTYTQHRDVVRRNWATVPLTTPFVAPGWWESLPATYMLCYHKLFCWIGDGTIQPAANHPPYSLRSLYTLLHRAYSPMVLNSYVCYCWSPWLIIAWGIIPFMVGCTQKVIYSRLTPYPCPSWIRNGDSFPHSPFILLISSLPQEPCVILVLSVHIPAHPPCPRMSFHPSAILFMSLLTPSGNQWVYANLANQPLIDADWSKCMTSPQTAPKILLQASVIVGSIACALPNTFVFLISAS